MTLPITEADLHAHLDGQLPPERDREVQAWLVQRPDEQRRLAAYRQQRQALRDLLAPVLHEPVPPRLQAAASRPRRRGTQRLVAGVVIALLGGMAGWHVHGWYDGQRPAHAPQRWLAERAAVAHAVYSPDGRRPVEVDGAHEQQLVTWLSKRMGTPVRAPQLQPLGYRLEGGRLLPGERAPVAQFMYADAHGARLTLYVSNELTGQRVADTGFQFARHGELNVFYWIDRSFGYALAGPVDRDTLARIAGEVHQQLSLSH